MTIKTLFILCIAVAFVTQPPVLFGMFFESEAATPTSDECSSIINSLKILTESFPCAREFCFGEAASKKMEPPPIQPTIQDPIQPTIQEPIELPVQPAAPLPLPSSMTEQPVAAAANNNMMMMAPAVQHFHGEGGANSYNLHDEIRSEWRAASHQFSSNQNKIGAGPRRKFGYGFPDQDQEKKEEGIITSGFGNVFESSRAMPSEEIVNAPIGGVAEVPAFAEMAAVHAEGNMAGADNNLPLVGSAAEPYQLSYGKGGAINAAVIFDPSSNSDDDGATASNNPSSNPPMTTTVAVAVESSVQVGSYIPSWFVYRKHYMGLDKIDVFDEPTNLIDAKDKYAFWAKDLETAAPKLTHLYYAFWSVTDKCSIKDADPDASWNGSTPTSTPRWVAPNGYCKGLMNDMMALKSKFPHLKLLVSIGGWKYSQNFSACAATVEGREKMYKSFSFLVNFMDKDWGTHSAIWNGVDFDWEFPAVDSGLFPNHDDNDWENFVATLNYFREQSYLELRHDIEISSAMGVGKTLSILASRPNGTAKAFCDAVNHVNLMEYDMWGKWAKTTGHNAPFCQDTRSDDHASNGLSVVDSVNELVAAGCDIKKLHLGLPSFSHAWTGIPAGPLGNGLFAESTKARWVGWGSYSEEDQLLVPDGIISWWDLKESMLNSWANLSEFSFNCPEDHGVVVPIKHVWSASSQLFASYEDEATIKAKAQWARKIGMGGFFFWDAQHDRRGDLLEAAREGYGDLPEHPATGSLVCYDDKRIDFSLDPSTGEPYPSECSEGSLTSTVTDGTTCYMLKMIAQNACDVDDTPIFKGTSRNGKCFWGCGRAWETGSDYLWDGDVAHFTCKEDA